MNSSFESGCPFTHSLLIPSPPGQDELPRGPMARNCPFGWPCQSTCLVPQPELPLGLCFDCESIISVSLNDRVRQLPDMNGTSITKYRLRKIPSRNHRHGSNHSDLRYGFLLTGHSFCLWCCVPWMPLAPLLCPRRDSGVDEVDGDSSDHWDHRMWLLVRGGGDRVER